MKKILLNEAVSMYLDPVYKSRHRLVMALSVMKKKIKGKYLGLIREIVKREGDVEIPGYIDKSVLYIVESKNGMSWKKIKPLEIKGIYSIIERCNLGDMYCLGLEDPDIWIDENNLVHVYYTIPYKYT